MKKYKIILKLIFLFQFFLIFCAANQEFGQPNTQNRKANKSLLKRSIPGYNPTIVINKKPSAVEYKAANIVPYGEWNDNLEETTKKIKIFKNQDEIVSLRSNKLDFNNERIFKDFQQNDFQKDKWVENLPDNNIFIRPGKFYSNIGVSANNPHDNYFYSSFPGYAPVKLPKITHEPVHSYKFKKLI